MTRIAKVRIVCIAAIATMAIAQEPPTAAFDLQWADIRCITLTPMENAISIELKMSVEKAYAFSKFTKENLGNRVEIRLNGSKVMEPLVREKITGDAIIFTATNLEQALSFIQKFIITGSGTEE